MKNKYLSLAALLVITSSLAFSNVSAETPTGLCNDGSPYLGANKQGACRGHKGIKEWYGNAAAPAPAATAESPSTTTANPPSNAVATGTCKDGTPYTGAKKQGACRGHKGLQAWFADNAAAKTPAQAPAPTAVTPAANTASTSPATGLCKDGTPYTGTTKQGACRGHKGIKEWFGDNTAAQPAAAAATTATTAPTPAATPAANGAATGLCKDGTPYTGTTKQGACRGHKGIKEWYGTTAPATTTSAPVAAEKPAATTAAPEPEEKVAPVTTTPVAGGGVDKVWVNDDSKIYHCHGTRFYGTTKSGAYMSEQQAIAGGNRADHNKPCNK